MQAVRHDPTQPGRSAAHATAVRDALMRIERWHGPLERRAAMLALLIDRDDEPTWATWAKLINHPATSFRVRQDLAPLGLDGRFEVFKSMVARFENARAEDLAAVRRDSRILARTPLARLRRLALLRHLRGSRLEVNRNTRNLDAALTGTVMTTAALAFVVSPANAVGWLGEVRQLLGAMQVSAPTLPRWSMRQALRLAPMERPRVANAWIKAARKLGLVSQDESREALMVAAWLLDTPTSSLR